MSETSTFTLRPIGIVRSTLTDLAAAPMQGDEGAPEAWLLIAPEAAPALLGLQTGDEIIILTWLHLSQRNMLQVHPRGDAARPLSGVFATRSPDWPNPVGLHRVTILEVTAAGLRVAPLEAIDGTPIVDIKPVLTTEDR